MVMCTCTPTIILLSTDKGKKLAINVYEGNTNCLLPISDMTEALLLEDIESVLENNESEPRVLSQKIECDERTKPKSWTGSKIDSDAIRCLGFCAI